MAPWREKNLPRARAARDRSPLLKHERADLRIRRARAGARARHAARPRAGALRPHGAARLRGLRRPAVRQRESRRRARPDVGRRTLGPRLPGGQLAPAHLALAHARRPALRARAGPAPPGERRAARAERGAPLRARASPDRRGLERAPRGGAVRAAPLAGRVRGLGQRAQGRALRRVLDADAARLRAPRAPRRGWTVRARVCVPRTRARGEVDAGHAAARDAAPRCLAARTPRARAAPGGAAREAALPRAPAPRRLGHALDPAAR